MKFAYADPPYFGCAVRHYGDRPDAAVYDTIDGHKALIERLVAEYPDGWALSMTSGNLRDLLPLCPREARTAVWAKPFASFKPNVGVAYAWEPVVLCGGRKRTREQPTIRDWFTANITLERGLTGAKPHKFVMRVLDLLNAQPDDEIDDIFPGSGAVAASIDGWREGHGVIPTTGVLFAEAAE